MRRAGTLLFVAMPFILAIGTTWITARFQAIEPAAWRCTARAAEPSGETICLQWTRQGGEGNEPASD